MKITVEKLKSMKGNEKISMLTAYDYSSAKVEDEVGIDVVLIGDSLGMVILGYDTTQKVTMQDIMRHTGAVSRGIKKAHIVADMPYKSYDTEEDAIKNAKLLIESGADSVKNEKKPEIAKALVQAGIDVMGHIGLTPQTITDFKVQGKDQETADKIKEEAKALEEAGCYALILECVPRQLAKEITEGIGIPTVGIGAGPDCDGQVLVVNDMLGLFTEFQPKFVKRYANLSDEMKKAIKVYNKEIKESKFPTDEQSFH
jgi:3-methyl-2-oxobutanoate hydroxymethyltransferase|tara:strand:- start:128 stop:898 length:771 start_codon:yes stop_codon:yes gene_type:complete